MKGKKRMQTDIETRLRELLLPVFGLEHIDEIPATASLIKDIGADSLDFVEITYLVEQDFGVVLKSGELLLTGSDKDTEAYFAYGKLSEENAVRLNSEVPGAAGRFTADMTRADLFATISARDLADLIARRLNQGAPSC
jgi:acyl carrier protein